MGAELTYLLVLSSKPTRGRQHVNRDITKVRSEWKEFKLISFNVRGINYHSKQQIVYDLLKHNRP